jgi:hypothetical protein
MHRKSLPEFFCWTRFGTEAGEAIAHILRRKEEERVSNAGVFIWGIGNAVGPSVRHLLERRPRPEVLFSPIRSSPKPQDVLPPAVAAWTMGETLNGDIYSLPEHSLVTSRYDPVAPKETHYALVCFSCEPIIPAEPVEEIPFAALRNLRTGRSIGASQVTAVVHWRPADSQKGGRTYDVAFRAELVYPYFLTLRRPVPLPTFANAHPPDDEWTRSAFQHLRQESARPKGGDPEPLQTAMAFQIIEQTVIED